MDDIFELQDDVVRQVVEALKVELSIDLPDVLVHPGTNSLPAYNEYLMGSFESKQHNARSYHKAAGHLRRSIELDPTYFAPNAALIFVIYWLSAMEGDPDGQLHAESEAALQRMTELDPQKANPGWNREGVIGWMRGEGQVGLEAKARDTILNAEKYHENYVAAAYGDFADVCRTVGLYSAQLAFFDRSRSMGYDHLFQRAEGWAALGFYDRAIECLVEDLRVNPQSAVSRSDLSTWLARSGQYEKAWQELMVLKEVWGPRHFAVFNYHYWKGEVDEAVACFDWLRDRKRFDPFYKGACSVMLGDVPAGLDYYWEAFETQSPVAGITRVLNDGYLSTAQLTELYAEERYQELMRRLGTHDDDGDLLMERMNSIKDVTGVEVRRDSEYR
jgi:hypothetical protein